MTSDQENPKGYGNGLTYLGPWVVGGAWSAAVVELPLDFGIEIIDVGFRRVADVPLWSVQDVGYQGEVTIE